MKWLILVVMMGSFSDGSKDTYLYFQPEFENVGECQDYVVANAGNIKRQMIVEFMGKPIDRVWCIRQDRIKDILDLNPGLKA